MVNGIGLKRPSTRQLSHSRIHARVAKGEADQSERCALSLSEVQGQGLAVRSALYSASSPKHVYSSIDDMDSRRLTVFPRTGTDWDNTSFIRRKDGAPPHRAPKAKTHSDQGPADPKLPKVSKIKLPARVKHKIFTPIDGDPGQYYRCIHIVDPEGERPYCLAQDTTSDATEHAYRVVMIRRGPDRSVVGLDKPNPNLLNIVSVFRFEGSLFTVFDRPGLALSEIAVSHSPQLGLAEVKTISAEVGPSRMRLFSS